MTIQIGKSGFNADIVKGLSLKELEDMFPDAHPRVLKELHKQVGSKSKTGKKSNAKKETSKED